MGRVALPESELPRQRRRLPKLRWPRAILAPALTLAAFVVVLAPDDWMRAIAALVLFAAAYVAGGRDGRLDLAVELMGPGRDRPPKPTPRSGEDAPSGQQG
jgi:hypothetical protein